MNGQTSANNQLNDVHLESDGPSLERSKTHPI